MFLIFILKNLLTSTMGNVQAQGVMCLYKGLFKVY